MEELWGLQSSSMKYSKYKTEITASNFRHEMQKHWLFLVFPTIRSIFDQYLLCFSLHKRHEAGSRYTCSVVDI